MEVPALAISSTDCRASSQGPRSRSGIRFSTASCSTSPSGACTGASNKKSESNLGGCHDQKPEERPLTATRSRPGADPGRRERCRRQAGYRPRRLRRVRAAGDHRCLPGRHRGQRTPGGSGRRRGRGGAAVARRQAGTPRGGRQQRWVLLDYLDLVVHVQHSEERQFYALERLWRDCPAIQLGVDERR